MYRHFITGLFALLALTPVVANASTNASDSNTAAARPVHPVPPGGSYYDWGRGQNGWGYCYQWSYDGYILNGGQPVPNYLCESTHPSAYNWGRGMDGWGYCYQWTPYGVPMNEGRPVANYSCEAVAPSYYQWARGSDGYTYCFQLTPNGLALNQGRPVPNYLCQ